MEYPDLIHIRSIKKSIEELGKEIEKLNKKRDYLSSSGIKNQKKIDLFQKKKAKMILEYEKVKLDIINSDLYKKMNPQMKEGCENYFFQACSSAKINIIYRSENNFNRDVKKFCFNYDDEEEN